MKTKILLLGIMLFTSACATSSSIKEDSLGLSKTSVFDTPSPASVSYPDTKAGKSERLSRAYSGFGQVPPQVPHGVERYLPISQDDNQCLECHDRLDRIDIKYHKGSKLPMSRSHYGGFNGKGDKKEVSGARFNCSQCHVPQSDAKPLVENTLQ
ncbi:MAG: nitrate reductase cytochrome c-type subunit [gamma proteobacterium symbiont of Bathyaustriella thionipta]|nr:nitrate reductase cytochrome c-type subunit [gamma proteobacterium symbiont of Bathyaustriella thionipta]